MKSKPFKAEKKGKIFFCKNPFRSTVSILPRGENFKLQLMDLFSQVKSLSWVQYLEGKLRANYHLIRRQTSVALRGSWLINAIFHLLTAAPPSSSAGWLRKWNGSYSGGSIQLPTGYTLQCPWEKTWNCFLLLLLVRFEVLCPAGLKHEQSIHRCRRRRRSDMGKPREPKLNAWDLFKGGTGMHSDKQDTFGNRTLSAWERVQNVRNVEEITVHFSKVAFRSFC